MTVLAHQLNIRMHSKKYLVCLAAGRCPDALGGELAALARPSQGQTGF